MTETMRSIGELLGQDEIWVFRTGRDLHEAKLDDMTLEHLKSLRAWLLRQADSIQYGIASSLYQIAGLVSGEAASDDLEAAMARLEEDPQTWMRSQPLFLAISDRLESVSPRKFNKKELAFLQHLVKLAIAAPPGTHTTNQLDTAYRLLRKLDGTGKQD